MLDIDDDCEAPVMPGACPNFVSDPSKYGKNYTFKTNLTLNQGTQCSITVDATKAVARVAITQGN